MISIFQIKEDMNKIFWYLNWQCSKKKIQLLLSYGNKIGTYCNAGLQVLEFISPFLFWLFWLVLFIQLCQLKEYKTVHFAWWCCSNCRNISMNTWVWMKMSCTTFDISGKLFMIHCLFLLKYKWIPAYIKIVGTVVYR